MRKLLLSLPPVILMTLPFISTSASAIPPVQAADVKSFDVGGVKTGMSVEEARAAMQKNFNVTADKIRATKSRKDQVPTLITGTEQILYLVYENNGTRMQVSFEPRVPYDKTNPMAASIVSYEMPWSKDNETAIKEAALAKYGPVSTGGVYPIWCEKPLPTSGMGCDLGAAKLEMSSSGLKLFDPVWQNARIEFMDRQRTSKPQF